MRSITVEACGECRCPGRIIGEIERVLEPRSSVAFQPAFGDWANKGSSRSKVEMLRRGMLLASVSP